MFADAIRAFGVQRAYGVVGGGVARLVSALHQAGITVYNCRHESGAAFMACEDYHATGIPPVVFMTTGPGFTNVITGLTAASWESAKILVITGATDSSNPEMTSVQDTNDRYLSLLRPIMGPGTNTVIAYCRQAANCQQLLDRWAEGLAMANGFIGLAMIPLDLQKREANPYFARIYQTSSPLSISTGFLEDVAMKLSSGETWFWLGWGAREYTKTLREIIDHLEAKVICSARAKGVYPETRKNFIGVTGFAGSEEVLQLLDKRRPDNLVVLGTRLNEFTSFWDAKYSPNTLLIHVDVDAQALTHNFMSVPKVAVQEHIGEFLRGIRHHLPLKKKSTPTNKAKIIHYCDDKCNRSIHPGFVMKCIQETVVDKGLPVHAELGNSFAWAIHLLRFDTPNFRTSTTYSSMGHFSAGVVGAALATQSKVFAIVGDGALLMQNEISTAVKYEAPCVWAVLNDHGYGMVRHGFKAINLPAMDFDIPIVDFVALAQSLGANGRKVEHSSQLKAALEEAIEAEGPFIVDVVIDTEPEPQNRLRNKALR
jgi:acetolactate synthase I/II/III large subunit